MLQEQAFVDPDHPGDPSKSPYAKAVSNNAQGYVSYATTTWANLAQARRNNIILTSPSSWGDPVEEAGYPPVERVCWRWEDELTGAHGPNHVGYTSSSPEQRAAAQAEIPPQQNAVVGALTSDLGDPDTIIANWRTLITTPLPPQS